MVREDYPVLDADGIPADSQLPALVLQDRIEDDPIQAQRIFGVLIEDPSPTETSYAALTHDMGRQGVEAIKTFRSIILSGLLRYLSYDMTTQANIDNDPAYVALRARRRGDSGVNWTERELEKHRVKIGATELYHFAGRVASAQSFRAVQAPSFEDRSEPSNVLDIHRTAS